MNNEQFEKFRKIFNKETDKIGVYANSEPFIAYKATERNMKCRNKQYRIGKTYKLKKNEKMKICHTGFHGCLFPEHVTSYYSLHKYLGMRLFKVKCDKALSDASRYGCPESKFVCSEITFLEEIPHEEAMTLLGFDKDAIYYIVNEILLGKDKLSNHYNHYEFNDILDILMSKNSKMLTNKLFIKIIKDIIESNKQIPNYIYGYITRRLNILNPKLRYSLIKLDKTKYLIKTNCGYRKTIQSYQQFVEYLDFWQWRELRKKYLESK